MNDELIKSHSEGKVYIHRYFTSFMSKTVFYGESYYVVRRGKVYFIQPDFTERESDDNVLTTMAECECLGIYDKDKIVRHDFQYLEINKIRKRFIKKQ